MTTLIAGCAALWDLIAEGDDVPAPGSVGILRAGPGSVGEWLPGGAAPTVALAMAVEGCAVALWHPMPTAQRDDATLRLASAGVDLSRCPAVEWAGHCVVIRSSADGFLWSSVTPTPPDSVDWDLTGIDHVVICPRWDRWVDGLLASAYALGIKKSLVGILPREALALEWDVVVVSHSQTAGIDLANLQTRVLAVTEGSQGSHVRTEQGWTTVPPHPTTVVDATGAGDVYAGVLLAGLDAGGSPADSARRASAAAAASCQGWGAQFSLTPAPRRGAEDLSERVRGALWGLACGDAFGMPNSFIPNSVRSRRFGTLIEMVGAPDESPYHRGYVAGKVTDDTEQALALTAALARSDGALDPELVAAELWDWLDRNGGPESLAVGPSTRAGLLAWRKGVPLAETGKRGTSNGGAMRITPIGVVHGLRRGTPDDLLDSVRAACLVTHNTVPAVCGAAAIAGAVAAGVAGLSWSDVLESGIQSARAARVEASWVYAPDVARRIEQALAVASNKTDDDFLAELSQVVGTGEPASEAVPAAFAIASRAHGDPARAIRLAGNAEGDADTIAAMAGAICGSWAGETRIPREWRELVAKVNGLDVHGWAEQLSDVASRSTAGTLR
jgi:ADP-ribosylglycohydrolase/sugar/nucleoside kinase (ribokinase family)